MRVALVTPRYPPVSPGGGQRSAELLATNLATSDDISGVTVYSFDGRGRSRRDGVDVRRLGAVSSTVTELQNLVVLPKLRGRLEDFDVVHGYNMELHPVIGFLSDRTSVPSVATLNSYHFFRSSVINTTADGLERLYEYVGYPTTGRLLRHYMKRIDVFVALSGAVQRLYEGNGFADCRFRQIPNMVDPDFEVPPRGENRSAGTSLLYVGTLTENKGVRYLLDAVAALPPDYSLRIVGDGPLAGELDVRARQLGIADRVTFSGRIPYDDVGEAYATADVFVHPGIWPEPLNRTVFEAMQARLPVVCTDVGGPPEVIPDEEFLCEPAAPTEMASAIERASAAGPGVGERNHDYVLEAFSPEAVISQIIDLYADLVG
jgi:starch synthase